MKPLFLLLASLLCLGQLFAQVGINNPNPSQTLDVGGKIKVGDDQITPVAGTIRYNRVSKTFEGYDGTEWSVFNPEEDDAGMPLPSGTVVTAIADFQFGDEFIINPEWHDRVSGTSFTEVPAGRTLYVSYLNFRSFVTQAYNFILHPTNQFGTELDYGRMTAGDTSPTRNQEFHDPNGYLLIIPSGGRLKVRKSQGSGHVYLRGFLQ